MKYQCLVFFVNINFYCKQELSFSTLSLLSVLTSRPHTNAAMCLVKRNTQDDVPGVQPQPK